MLLALKQEVLKHINEPPRTIRMSESSLRWLAMEGKLELDVKQLPPEPIRFMGIPIRVDDAMKFEGFELDYTTA